MFAAAVVSGVYNAPGVCCDNANESTQNKCTDKQPCFSSHNGPPLLAMIKASA
jgi:hypothetical protein